MGLTHLEKNLNLKLFNVVSEEHAFVEFIFINVKSLKTSGSLIGLWATIYVRLQYLHFPALPRL